MNIIDLTHIENDIPGSGGSADGSAAAAAGAATGDASNTAAAASNSGQASDAGTGGDKGASTPGEERKNEDGSVMTPEQIAADDQRIADEAAYNAGPPETYEFKLPEGYALEGERLDSTVALFKKFGFSGPKAQEAIDAFVKADGENRSMLTDMLEAKRRDDIVQWGEQSKARFGTRYDEIKEEARKGVEAMKRDPDCKHDELLKKFNEQGWGNDPDLIAAFRMIGKLSADSPMRGIAGEGASGDKELPMEQRMYPGMTKP